MFACKCIGKMFIKYSRQIKVPKVAPATKPKPKKSGQVVQFKPTGPPVEPQPEIPTKTEVKFQLKSPTETRAPVPAPKPKRKSPSPER